MGLSRLRRLFTAVESDWGEGLRLVLSGWVGVGVRDDRPGAGVEMSSIRGSGDDRQAGREHGRPW